MAETIRDVVIKVKIEKGKADLNFTELTPVAKQLKDIETNAAKMGKQFESTAKLIADSQTKVNRALADGIKEVKATGQHMTDLRIKAADGFTRAAEGALVFARGLTFLGVSSEDSLKKVVQNLAAVQGAIDLLKGSKDFAKGLIEGGRALQASLGGARIAAVALQVATGPVGLAVAAVTAVVAVGVSMWKSYEEQQRKVEEQEKRLAAARKKSAEEAKTWFEAQKKLAGELRSTFSGSASDRISRAEMLASERGRPADTLGELNRVRQLQQSRIPDLASATLALDVRTYAQGAGRSDVTQFAEEQLRNVSAGEKGSQSQQQDAAKALITIKREAFEIDQRGLEILKQEESLSKQRIANAKTELQLAKDKLAAEESRVQSLEERVGRMDPLQLGEFKRLSQKAQGGGELSKQELARLEELGGSGVSDFTGQKFAQFGQQQGGANLFSPFQGGGPQTGSGSQLEAMRKAVQDQQATTAKVIEAETAMIQANNQMQTKTVDRLQGVSDEINVLLTRLDKLELDMQRRGLNGK